MSTIQLYKTYSFREKDPVIDELRTAMQDSGFDKKDLSEGSGVSIACFRAWFDGPTKRPQYATIKAAARAMGYDYVLTKQRLNGHVKKKGR